MERKYVVDDSKVTKKIDRLPKEIILKFYSWAKAIEIEGLPKVRKRPGYHDKPLRGKRQGQRSVRLSLAYRIIYEEKDEKLLCIIVILEVNKHEY